MATSTDLTPVNAKLKRQRRKRQHVSLKKTPESCCRGSSCESDNAGQVNGTGGGTITTGGTTVSADDLYFTCSDYPM